MPVTGGRSLPPTEAPKFGGLVGRGKERFGFGNDSRMIGRHIVFFGEIVRQVVQFDRAISVLIDI